MRLVTILALALALVVAACSGGHSVGAPDRGQADHNSAGANAD